MPLRDQYAQIGTTDRVAHPEQHRGGRMIYTNRRAPRGRDGRASGDHLGGARWHMQVWAEWTGEPKPNPWPRESSEVRALASRQAQTNRKGRAAYRGRVELADGKWARKEAPLLPKETPPQSGSREPRIDRRRIGPMVDRLLIDFVAEGGEPWVRVLQAEYLHPEGSQEARAVRLGISPRSYKYRLREGLNWLAGRLSWVALERRQAGLSDER